METVEDDDKANDDEQEGVEYLPSPSVRILT